MADYLTTREVAKYLRLNQKKVYDLVSKGEIPSARISGKWLFPKHLIDRWIDASTRYPRGSLVSHLLEHMVLLQGSDDPLLSRLLERQQAALGVPILTARIGSRAGLEAVREGLAHLGCCHLGDEEVEAALGRSSSYYLIELFGRSQGLLIPSGTRRRASTILRSRPRFAFRQAGSGTRRLTDTLLAEVGVEPLELPEVGPFGSHLEVALAVRRGEADAGLGIRWAAETCGLGFVPLAEESFKLAVPRQVASSPTVTRLLEQLLAELPAACRQTVGYDSKHLGRIQAVRS